MSRTAVELGKGRSIQRVAGSILRLGALGVAALAAMATSGGEANDEEDVPGGNDPGGETHVGDDPVDFTEVTEPTTVVVGGSDFVLTSDGRYVITLRAEWYGGGGVETELRSRQLLAMDTQDGQVVGALDVRDAGSFGVVLLSDPRRLVVVRRGVDHVITGLERVRLPDLVVVHAYAPVTRGNTVRLSPSGRYVALWTVAQWGLPSWNLYFSMPDQVVGIEDRLGVAAPLRLTTLRGVADVIAAPDDTAFYVALSTRDPDADPLDYSLAITRVSLGSGFHPTTLVVPQAGHAADNEIRGGSALRLSPTGDTLTFSGCSFVTGTCVARWYVLNAPQLSLRGDLRAAGASAFTPDGGRGLGWDGRSNEDGKIWATDCVAQGGSDEEVDHWLVDVNLETLAVTPIDLPKLAPYYFVTRDGALAVVSVENCYQEELWVVDLETGAASAIHYGDHGLHHFTVLEDHRTIYSVDEGVLERIDLEERESRPASYLGWVSRVNRLPGGERLVLADPDLLIFTLWDASTEQTLWRRDLTTLGANPAPVPPQGVAVHAPLPRAASAIPELRLPERLMTEGFPSEGPRELRPRTAGGVPGLELRF